MSDLDGSAVASLRRLNGSKVLSVLRTEAYRKFTVREMSIATGLSRPTVGRLLDDLVEAGWALDAEGKPGATGRPARRYWFNRLRGLVLSIDIGFSGMGVMVTDLVGSELAWDYSLGVMLETVDEAVEFMLPRLEETLTSVRASAETDSELPVLAVSISAPVIADADGKHLDALRVVAGWRGGNFLPALRERFGDIPILVTNDLVLGAEAEISLGALTDAEQGLFCYLAAFSSTVLTHNGKVHEGAFHLAGDIGSLAEYRWPDATRTAQEMTGYTDPPRVQAFIDEALSGDENAQRAVRLVGETVARGVADLAALWDPDVIVFAGQFAEAGPLFLEPVEEALRALGHDDFELRPTEVPAAKGSALGGVIRALDSIDWTV